MTRKRLDVTVRHGQRSHAPRDVVLHRTAAIRPCDLVRRDDTIVHASPLRILFDLAGLLPEAAFEQAVHDALHKNLVAADSMIGFWEGLHERGRGGSKRFGEWATRLSNEAFVPSQSGLEVRLQQALVSVGLPTPLSQYEVVLSSGGVIHLDHAYPDVMLGIETDHRWWHDGPRRGADRNRDRALEELGWVIIRFDEHDLDDAMACARQVARIYRARRRQLGVR
jgi:hypothetical protein